MMRRFTTIGAVFVGVLLAAPPPPALDFDTPVSLAGIIKQVRIVRGQGAPYLEIDSGGKPTRVILGSMRYLVQHDFNPRAGEKIRVEGFLQPGGEIVAREITLQESGQTLTFRGAAGTPLWRRSRYGRQSAGEHEEAQER